MLGEVRGENWEAAPRKKKHEIGVEPSAKEFQIVANCCDNTNSDEDPQKLVDLDRTNDAKNDGATKAQN